MNVHKILAGEGAERLLPFALSKLRFLASTVDHPVVQTYYIGTGRVVIEYNPQSDQHVVRIDAGGGDIGYEFFTTYDLIGNYGGTAWWATAVIPQPADADVKLKPKKLSTAFGATPPIPLVPRDPMARAINLQRNAEYHWWPWKDGVTSADGIRTKPYFMTSTLGAYSWQAASQDFQGYLSSFSWVRQQIARTYEFGTDLSVDAPPSYYREGKVWTAMPYPTMPDWPRRAAVMEVEGRRFVIMSDMQSNFRAFPASYMTTSASAYLFHPSRAKIVRPADYMQVGVVQPSMATMTPIARDVIIPGSGGVGWFVPAVPAKGPVHPYSEFPDAPIEPGADETKQYQKHHYLWDFHPSGTRAVAVVDLNKNNGHPHLTTDIGAGREPLTVLAEYGPQYHIPAANAGDQWVIAAGGATTVGVCERGVIEVEFHITITGPGEDDFTFSVTQRRILGGGWYIDAQYAYCDARLEALGVQGGDLLTDELRLYCKTPAETVDLTVWDSYLVTRNQDHIADVATFCVAKNRPFYMYEASRSVRVDMGTYAGTPPPIRRWFLTDMAATGDYGLARMVASDLRSMSKVFGQSRNGEPVGLHVVVFGETRQGSALSRTPAESSLDGLGMLTYNFITDTSQWAKGSFPADDVQSSYPIALHRLVWDQAVNGYGFDISVATGIASHPDGHFAVFAHHYDAIDTFDLIEYRRVTTNEAGTKTETFDRTTHAAAWTAAFGMAFDPVAYAALVVGNTPFVMQRFASWRNVKLPKVSASADVTMNDRLKDPL